MIELDTGRLRPGGTGIASKHGQIMKRKSQLPVSPLFALLALLFTLVLPAQLAAQTDTSRLDELERRVTRAEHRSHNDGAAGVAVFVCAAFCALWAQQTGRNAWLWFFLGLLFSVITLLVLLAKNSSDKAAKQ